MDSSLYSRKVQKAKGVVDDDIKRAEEVIDKIDYRAGVPLFFVFHLTKAFLQVLLLIADAIFTVAGAIRQSKEG